MQSMVEMKPARSLRAAPRHPAEDRCRAEGDLAIVFQSFLPKFSTVSPALLFSSPRFFFRLSGPYNYLGAVTASSLRTCSPLTYDFSVRAGLLETASAIIVITIVLNLCFVFQVLLDVLPQC